MYEYEQFETNGGGLREEISEIVGKRITGLVAKKQGTAPRTQVFLMFDDGTYIELYGTSTGEIQWYRGCDTGGLQEIESYVAQGYSPIALLKCARLDG
jgi:hypothetical protein